MAELTHTFNYGLLSVSGSLYLSSPLTIANGGIGNALATASSRPSYSLLITTPAGTEIGLVSPNSGIYSIMATNSKTSGIANITKKVDDEYTSNRVIYINWTGAALTQSEAKLAGIKNGIIRPVESYDVTAGNATKWHGITMSFGSQSSTNNSISIL